MGVQKYNIYKNYKLNKHQINKIVFLYFYDYVVNNFDNIIENNIFDNIINLNLNKNVVTYKITLLLFTVFLFLS